MKDNKRKDPNFFKNIKDDSDFDIFINPYREKTKRSNLSDFIWSKNKKINDFILKIVTLILKPKIKVFYFVVCAIVFLGLLAVAISTNQEYVAQRLLLQEDYGSYRVAAEKLESKNQELYSERITDAFTEIQLIRMKEKFNRYALLVNNKQIKGNTYTVESTTDKIVITFYERFERDSNFPFPGELIHSVSVVKEDTIDGLIMLHTNEATYSFRTEIADDGRKVHIDFNNVNPGEIITLDIAYDFAQRLGLDDGSIEIFYAKTN